MNMRNLQQVAFKERCMINPFCRFFIFGNYDVHTLLEPLKYKENDKFPLYFAHLIVPLTRCVQVTHVRKYKENNKFFFVFRSLNRIFDAMRPSYSRSEI